MMRQMKRLLALLLALLFMAGAACAEEAVPMDAAPVEEVVPELGEIALPGEADGQTPVELAPEADAAVLAPEAEAFDPVEPVEADPDAMVSAPGSFTLSTSAFTLGQKEKRQLVLASGAAPQAVGAVFASSDPKIAEVDAAGLVTARKVGTATIEMNACGVASSCVVTVVKAPKKVTLSAKKLELGAGEAVALGVSIPEGTASAIQFASDKPGVASVDANGIVVAQGAGKATITATACNGKRAKCKVTVAPAPTYITANVGALSLWVGRSFEIEPILTPGSGGSIYCASDNPGVVQIDGWTARAVGQGSATIVLSTYNGLRTEIPVTVGKTPVYRALVIGEGTFPGSGMSDLPGKRDVALMERMLASVGSPSGNGWAVQTGVNLNAAQIRAAIQSAFAGAERGDVSLFYISTHGDQDFEIGGRYSSYAGYLLTYPDFRYGEWYDCYGLTLGRLAGWLAEVPGQVVVMIDSCGSGAAVYGAGVSAPALSAEDFDAANLIETRAFSPEAFDQAVVDAFRDVDQGVLGPGQGAFVVENKFFVLTSCAYRESGWSASNKYSYFTKWLTDAIKTKGRMPADANRNRYTTLNELFNCMKKKAAKKTFRYQGVSYKQHLQVYPGNCGLELFFR